MFINQNANGALLKPLGVDQVQSYEKAEQRKAPTKGTAKVSLWDRRNSKYLPCIVKFIILSLYFFEVSNDLIH